MAKNEPVKRVAMSEKRIGFEAAMVVSNLTDTCLYSGFFGHLDSARMKTITDQILEAIEGTGNDCIVIDLSNVDIIDSAVAAHLIKTGDVIKLIGADVIFCGIRSQVGQAMVTVGVEFSKYIICKDLKTALRKVYELKGLELAPIKQVQKNPVVTETIK
jgi:anti-anti-sigma regulatory factor